MATPVAMPQLGESVVEGTILTWLKHEGDAVEVDEPIVEISTEKVDTEIPSPVAGTLSKILVQEGETVEVGTPLAEIDEAGSAGGEAPAKPAAAPEPAPEPAEEAPKPEPKPAAPAPEPELARPAASAPAATQPADGRVLSPLVRRMAREYGVDVNQVPGTGADGRITKQDILDFVEKQGAAAPEQVADAPAAAAAPAAPAPVRAAPPTVRAAAGEREEVKPLSHIRKRIAEHMTKSLQVSARAWNAIEVDMEGVERVRVAAGPEFRAREGFSLTYLPFIARATVDALAAEALLNTSVTDDGEQVVYHHYVNLGIAVAVDYGLIVPVVKGAEAMNVVGLARATRDLAERARSKKLSPDEVTGSTFTITNPGPFGSFMSVPIINQPNVAILSTEAVEKRVVAVDDMIAIRHRTFLCLSWDHRVVDGSDAMRFLARLKQNLETWDFSTEVANP